MFKIVQENTLKCSKLVSFLGNKKIEFKPTIHPAAQNTLGDQQWNLLVSEHSEGFQIKIGRPKFYAGEMITLA